MKLKCLYASSSDCSDAFYISGVKVPDPYLSLIAGRHKIAIVNQLEYARVKKVSKYTKIYEIEALKAKIVDHYHLAKKEFSLKYFVQYFFDLYKANTILIPKYFPSFLLLELQKLKIPIELSAGSLFPEREQKSQEEIKCIKIGNKASAYGLGIAQSALKASRIKKGKLYLDGSVLSSERLRSMIELALFEKGSIASSTIVAGGIQASDPHQIGYGSLKANQLIIVDIFPKIKESGYHGDMTRTFLKGKANEAQKKLVYSVKEAQKLAVSKIKANVCGSLIHDAVASYFNQNGYLTEHECDSDSFVGFIHSTGHGLGLDIHEDPKVSIFKNKLKANHVITVEPGLYYPNIGSCRIEDVFAVTKEGSEKLSKFNYQWEIA
jgi:Xaa-Pro aminopeptidase